MTHLPLVLAVTALTFASRILFFRSSSIRLGRFFDVFPVALFVAIATSDLIAPEGQLATTPYLAALVGGGLAGLLLRRSMLAVVGGGLAAYWLTRLLVT